MEELKIDELRPGRLKTEEEKVGELESDGAALQTSKFRSALPPCDSHKTFNFKFKFYKKMKM